MREILFFCAMVGIVAVIAPQFLTEYAGSSHQQQARVRTDTPKTRSQPRTVRQSSHGTVEVRAGRNGHFVVTADVNLSPVRFVVDTGASFVALRESDAESAGIYLSESDFRHPVSTANGTAYGARVQLDSVAIEGIDLDRVTALVLPDQLLGVSLLGNSFLNRLDRFEVSDNLLVMEN